MFLSNKEALLLKNDMEKIDFSSVELIVCPSFINFDLFKKFKLCAQDCFYEQKGPYTGEVSCSNLKEIGINYALVGHSYRRKYDSNEIINSKIKSLLINDMIPILCIGEQEASYDLEKVKEILSNQLNEGLKDIILSDNKEIIIAYEPTWSIGSGIILSKNKLDEVIKIIKEILNELNIRNYRLLYGGSVDNQNIECILKCDLDGYLLGNSSVNIVKLKQIVEFTKKCK